MPTIKTYLLVAACLTCLFHLSTRADEVRPIANFDGDLAEVHMLDAKYGWASGQTKRTAYLLRTEDGGKSWSDISPRPMQRKEALVMGEATNALTFQLLDGTHGWAACIRDFEKGLTGEMDLFSTEDGGKHWQPNSFKSPLELVQNLQFVDEKHGFIGAVSNNLHEDEDQSKAIYRTADGGRTWQVAFDGSRKHPANGALPYLGREGGVTFRDEKEGWINGSPEGDQKECFFHTTDGGTTWQPLSLSRPPGMEEVRETYDTPTFFGPQKTNGVLYVGFKHDDPKQNVLVFYQTHDGGTHWEKTGSPPLDWSGVTTLDTAYADADHWWVLSNNQLFATTDRGATWSKVDTNLVLGKENRGWSMQFINPTHGWVLLQQWMAGPYGESELLQTVDGGRTWTHCFGSSLGGATP